jgi:hypothetical protein
MYLKLKTRYSTLKELKDGLGTKPVHTGRCYAEHIKNSQLKHTG